MTEKDAKLIAVFGARGTGKSTLTKSLSKGRKKLVVFDVRGEYQGAGFVRCHSLGTVKNIMRRHWSKGFKISYVPPRNSYHVEELHQLAELLWDVQEPYEAGRDNRKLTLVVEEAHMGFPNTQLPKDQQGMMWLVTMGRHRGLEGIAVTQRPAMLNTNYRANAAQTYIFPLEHDDDQAAVVKSVGRAHADEMRILADFNFMLRERGCVRMGKIAKSGTITIKK